MSGLTTRTFLGAVAVASVGAVFIAALPIATGLLTVLGVVAALAGVAFASQSARLRGEQGLAYRPVYVRNTRVRRPLRSIDD